MLRTGFHRTFWEKWTPSHLQQSRWYCMNYKMQFLANLYYISIMKTACTFIFLVIIPSILTAQINDSLKLRKHEIGINVNSLLNEIIPGGENQILLSPYLLTYHFAGRHHAFRFGFGVVSNSRIDNDTLIIYSNSSLS